MLAVELPCPVNSCQVSASAYHSQLLYLVGKFLCLCLTVLAALFVTVLCFSSGCLGQLSLLCFYGYLAFLLMLSDVVLPY